VILAGGASRRYGRDKALAQVDGRAMVLRVHDALLGVGPARVVVVGGDGAALRASGLDWVPDRWPGEGPLGGVLTGLEAVGEPWVLILACDLPHLTPDALQPVVAACARSSAEVVVPVCEGRRQPLAAGYRRSVLAALSDEWARGERSLRGALALLDVEELSVPAALVAAFTDHDTPGDGGALA
jgi:molybdopterin-guanine dinucleotide biosynthesis protein A